MNCRIDHLVVACRNLEQGDDFLRETLGVLPQRGGKHVTMGTHNHLLKLGNAYLELIAIDPEAKQLERRRWFDLDDPKVQERANQRPFLLTWVASSDDAVEAETRIPALGKIHSLTRNQFSWRITIPDDGQLVFDGVLPSIIQWDSGNHPTDFLKERNCELLELKLSHPAAESVAPLFKKLNVQGVFNLVQGPQRLLARIRTENGIVDLE